MEKIVKAGLRDCTVNLDGTECSVKFDSCFRVFAVRNDSAGDVFISKTAGIVPDADGIMSVKAGASTVYAHMDIYADTVYLLGQGKVQIHAQNDTVNPFNYAPAMDGGEERGESSYTIENAVDYPLLGLNLYGKSVQDGVPTPENPVEIVSVGDSGTVNIISNNGGEIAVNAAITSALPLCGIPVESGGNYTDSNGQQWVCDELIYNADGSGKIVKRILKFVFDGNTNWGLSEQASTEMAFTKDNNDVYETVKNNDLVGVVKSDLAQLASRNFLRNNPYYVGLQMEGYACIGFSLPKGQYTETEWKEIAKGHYVLLKYKNPKEIELSAAEMTALRDLQTFDGTTNIFNDGGADMDVEFCTNKTLSEYVAPITTSLQSQINELKAAVLSLGGNI